MKMAPSDALLWGEVTFPPSLLRGPNVAPVLAKKPSAGGEWRPPTTENKMRLVVLTRKLYLVIGSLSRVSYHLMYEASGRSLVHASITRTKDETP